MNLLPILGLLSGACFAWAAVPSAFRTFKAGKTLGTPLDIMVTIFVGTLLMFTYLTAAHGFDWVLAVNCTVEAASWGVLLYYRLFRQ